MHGIVIRVKLVRGPHEGPGKVAGTSQLTQGSSSLLEHSFCTSEPLGGTIASVDRIGTGSKELCISIVFSYFSLVPLKVTVRSGVETSLYYRALRGTGGSCPSVGNYVVRSSENDRCADRRCQTTMGGCKVVRDVGDTNKEYRSGTHYRDV